MLNPLHELRTASRGFKVSIVEGTVAVLGSALANSMVIPLMLRMGADANLLALYTALVMASTPPLQLLAVLVLDRYREQRLHITYICAAASRAMWLIVAVLIPLGATGLWPLVATLWLSNALMVVCGLAWTDLIADLVEPSRQGRLFAMRNTLLGAINVAGLLLAKLIYDDLGYPHGYLIAILAGTALLLVTVPLLYMYGDPVKREGLGLGVHGVFSALKDKEMLRDSTAFAAWSFSVNIVGAIWNYHLYGVYGADEKWFTTLNLVGAIVGTLANPPWGSFYDRFGPKATFLMSGLGTVIVPALFTMLPSLPGQALLLVYSTSLWSGFNLSAFNYAVSYRSELRHVYMTACNVMPSIAAALGTLAGVQMYNAVGILAFLASTVFRLCALIMLYAVVSPRAVSYEELRIISHLYPLYLAGRHIAQVTYFEFTLVVRILYTIVLLALILAMLVSLAFVLMTLLR